MVSNQTKEKHGFSFNLKMPSPPLKAIVINDPKMRLDEERIFEPAEEFVPREAAITENGKLKPILVYAPTVGNALPDAKGKVKFGTKWEELGEGWKYLTPAFMYKDQSTSTRGSHNFKTPNEFINKLAEGELWESPETMGPYQYGNCLALRGLQRQRTKSKRLEAAARLEKSIKMMAFTMVGAALFLIIIQNG